MYVDDLCIAAQDPKEIINILKSKYNLKVKGDGPLTYHTGEDMDTNGSLTDGHSSDEDYSLSGNG